jgi:uncharacterized membrane protein YbhN (UPF0104 family)
MKRNRWLMMGVVLAVLVVLVYIQVRTLRSFQWTALAAAFKSISWPHLLLGLGFTYAAYFTRAFRWSIFLRRSRPATNMQMIPAQFIGFTAIAVLGRLGEFVRPYLIARRQRITFASQLGVLTVERVFDLLAAATIIAITLTFSASVRMLPYQHEFRRFGYFGIAVALGLALATVAIRVAGPLIGSLARGGVGLISARAGEAAREKVLAFSAGLDAVGGWMELLLVLFYSFATWGLILLAYIAVVHGFRVPELEAIPAAQTVVLMAASMAGSVLQLPVVGGGSQMATIEVLNKILGVGAEAATACGLTLFAVTFLGVVPAGLIFARVEQVSLSSIARVSETEGERVEGSPAPVSETMEIPIPPL